MTRDLILGTAGHIDHGKTTLVRALTGTDCDRLPEEKARGITIDIGFATLDLGDYRLGIVDVPGHERFIKNMLAGATGIDLAILVISAKESVKPQTVEHLEILRLLGLRHGILVRRARQLPVAIPHDDFTAHAFERTDGLWRLLPRGEDQNFRLGHERSVVDGPGEGTALWPRETAGGMRRGQLSWMPLSLNT